MSELQSKILKLLEDGQFHSGESLGERLGVSRTAVWKQLQKLEAIGLQLESVKGTGYRVPAGFELLDHTFETERIIPSMPVLWCLRRASLAGGAGEARPG